MLSFAIKTNKSKGSRSDFRDLFFSAENRFLRGGYEHSERRSLAIVDIAQDDLCNMEKLNFFEKSLLLLPPNFVYIYKRRLRIRFITFFRTIDKEQRDMIQLYCKCFLIK